MSILSGRGALGLAGCVALALREHTVQVEVTGAFLHGSKVLSTNTLHTHVHYHHIMYEVFDGHFC